MARPCNSCEEFSHKWILATISQPSPPTVLPPFGGELSRGGCIEGQPLRERAQFNVLSILSSSGFNSRACSMRTKPAS